MIDSTTDDATWQHALNADPNAVPREGTNPTRRPRPGHGGTAPAPEPAAKTDPWERALEGPPFVR